MDELRREVDFVGPGKLNGTELYTIDQLNSYIAKNELTRQQV